MSTFEEQLVAEYFKHFITNNLNLGQYKSELWCKCGDKLIVDGHARDWHSITEEVFYRHVADKQAAAHQSELDLAVKEARIDELKRAKRQSYITQPLIHRVDRRIAALTKEQP